MIYLDGHSLNLAQLELIARGDVLVSINEKSITLINKASNYIDELIHTDNVVYGINTGFGHLSQVKIDNNSLEDLQLNLLKSHACGVGEVLDPQYVRAMMALRINALIQGYSGIRVATIKQMLLLLNENIIPVVFSQGSLGASGDLALLSHMSLPLLGLGEVFYLGQRMPARAAYKLSGLTPLPKLYPKEGLSLINGTQAMNALGALSLIKSYRLLNYANLALAFTMEALEGIIDAYDEDVHKIRRQSSQVDVASVIRKYLEQSKNIQNGSKKRVQDAYSLRCAPQVHGAVLGALRHIKEITENEMNAVTDNPLIFYESNKIISAGNFHGEPLALAYDYLGMAMSELANISERRIERLVNPQLNNGLPPFLTNNSGLNSGFMIVQYTAAALVSENKVLAHPASVDSIPSSANQEDHVSMGSVAALKVRDIINNTKKVIALEMFASFQALNFRGSKNLAPITKKLFDYLSQEIPFIKEDEIMYPYIHKIEDLLERKEFYHHLFDGGEIVE